MSITIFSSTQFLETLDSFGQYVRQKKKERKTYKDYKWYIILMKLPCVCGEQ